MASPLAKYASQSRWGCPFLSVLCSTETFLHVYLPRVLTRQLCWIVRSTLVIRFPFSLVESYARKSVFVSPARVDCLPSRFYPDSQIPYDTAITVSSFVSRALPTQRPIAFVKFSSYFTILFFTGPQSARDKGQRPQHVLLDHPARRRLHLL